MTSEHTVPRRTRPANANKHPSEIVLQAKSRRCTTEEIAAANEAKSTKSVANQAGIKHLAGIELKMEKKQVDALTRKAQPRWRITKMMVLDSENALANPNFTFSGKIQNWISGVDKPFKPHTLSTQKSSASVPPSTTFTHLTETSKVTVESTISAKTTEKSGDVLIGGFDDEEEDDSLECQLAQLTVKKGQELAMTSVALTHDDSDAGIYDDEPKAPFTQHSEAWSVPKRKAADILEVSSASEIEDFDTVASDHDLLSDSDDYSMEVDSTHSDLKPETSQPVANLKQDPALLMKTLSKLQKACCATNSTSVTTVDMDTPAPKRVKTTAPINATPAQAQQPVVQCNMPAKSVKPWVQYRNTNLPAPVQGDQRWTKKFLPTVLLWMGSLEDDLVWTIADANLLKHIQVVFDAVYLELSIQLVQNGVVFSLTVQWLSEWRSNFGSTAITIIIDFLTSDKECDPQVLVGLLLNNFTFLFSDMDTCDPLGVYHSAFMLQLFGKAHLANISGHANVPALKTHVLTSSGMLERTVEMISTGDIKAENILASALSSKTNIKLLKVLNKVTGKETNAPFLFSRDRCAKKTKQYAMSIKKKGPAFIASLTDIARSGLKECAAWDSAVTEDESEDERALLCIYKSPTALWTQAAAATGSVYYTWSPLF
ncbi:uncharacterized protein EDB91DRAFT_1088646 [Suillus paluster]|uniref:uncharacterized protein n=1 Tax=Suillus paluster TaxID=48578 RepID=UPI001B87B211|nr:uncharacterized protein EDB91DRAFT_1088646 [Suillus paluster]KAG1720917.1 hypothetical protein EDB91DRAFT_1088646 [Suillus paluster]